MSHTRSSEKKWSVPGRIVTLIMLAVTAALLFMIFSLRMLPTMYIAAIVIVCIVVLLVTFLLTKTTGKKVRFIIGIIWTIIWILIYCFGIFNLNETRSALKGITDAQTETTVVSFYVKEADPAQSLRDIDGYNFGILSDMDRSNTDEAVTKVRKEQSVDFKTTEYSSLAQLADALTDGDIDGIVLNQAFVDVYTEMPGYEQFPEQIRVIGSVTLKHTVSEEQQANNDDVITIYISGSDTRNSTLPSRSRSDVNIIASLNPKTHKIVLISTPRDYYVPLSISGGVPDKLTHAGIYGIDVSMDTLSELYGINIDYYFKVNFNGFIDIINALGGIRVQSDYDFEAGGYQFGKGANYLNGEAALAFARERHAFTEGDLQRGENQMSVIEGVIQKCMSPAILKNYTSVLNSAESCMETNIPYSVLAKLVQDQLSSGTPWQITRYSVNGTGDRQVPYSMNISVYVMRPDYDTVEHAKALLQQNQN